jgi:hypothetical protein
VRQRCSDIDASSRQRSFNSPNGEITMARLLRAARVTLNIHPNEKSSLWRVWPYWVEF